jgi:hypothetical protein
LILFLGPIHSVISNQRLFTQNLNKISIFLAKLTVDLHYYK